MKKFIGLAVLPVILAANPLLALAEQHAPTAPKAETPQTSQITQTKTQASQP